MIPEQPIFHTFVLTLEEVHALGLALDRLPIQPKYLEDQLESVYDFLDPILTEAYGPFWEELA